MPRCAGLKQCHVALMEVLPLRVATLGVFLNDGDRRAWGDILPYPLSSS